MNQFQKDKTFNKIMIWNFFIWQSKYFLLRLVELVPEPAFFLPLLLAVLAFGKGLGGIGKGPNEVS
jgi:hypothetical protein